MLKRLSAPMVAGVVVASAAYVAFYRLEGDPLRTLTITGIIIATAAVYALTRAALRVRVAKGTSRGR